MRLKYVEVSLPTSMDVLEVDAGTTARHLPLRSPVLARSSPDWLRELLYRIHVVHERRSEYEDQTLSSPRIGRHLESTAGSQIDAIGLYLANYKQNRNPFRSLLAEQTTTIMATRDTLSDSHTFPSDDSENYDANHSNSNDSSDEPASASSSPLILYSPPTIWSILRGGAINLVLPLINGLMLGFGELVAHEAAWRLGWGGTKVSLFEMKGWL